jgi:2-polyprenyl-3-methyl-5-hydroxy-6-metoxy-1,4-benzoquinol methylase
MKLNLSEVEFDSSSYGDPNGRLFYWNDGVYRAISQKASSHYASLLKDGRLNPLFESGLVQTEITPLELEGYDLVLKHRKIPFVSFGFEWCGEMMKDAALLMLNLNRALLEIGYEFQDANPWNVLFDGCIPKYVDFGSIVPVSNNKTWPATAEFIKSILNPLLLFSRGLRDEAKKMMTDWRKWGVPNNELGELLPYGQWPHKLRQFFYLDFLSPDRKTLNRRLIEMVERIDFTIPETEWTNYYEDHVRLDSPDEWTPKQKAASDVLASLTPKTLLDIGSNTGWYSEMAAKNGCTVVAIDSDEACVQLLYDRFKKRNEVLPLLVDFSCPSPQYGTEGVQFRGATDRLQCDLVFAMGLVHHLAFKKAMKFDAIAKHLGNFTKKSLLVEFVPKEDRYVSEWYNQSYDWYTLENFIKALREGFSEIKILPSNRPPRSLILCERTSAGRSPIRS